MKFRRTHVFAVAAVASLSLGVAACGSEGPSGSSGTDAAVSADAATMWGLTGGATETVIKESISSWNPAHSDQQIKVDWFANDAYKTKVRTAMGAGQGPTIVWSWGGGTLADYVKSGQVDDMTSFVQSNPALAKKLPAGGAQERAGRREDVRAAEQQRAAGHPLLQQGCTGEGRRAGAQDLG